MSGRTRRSRQHTKDCIAELFLCGDTQGNAPGSKWAAVNGIVEYGDYLKRPGYEKSNSFWRKFFLQRGRWRWRGSSDNWWLVPIAMAW